MRLTFAVADVLCVMREQFLKLMASLCFALSGGVLALLALKPHGRQHELLAESDGPGWQRQRNVSRVDLRQRYRRRAPRLM